MHDLASGFQKYYELNRVICRFILLEGDATKSYWSRICVSHADCVLLVGYGNGDASVSATPIFFGLCDMVVSLRLEALDFQFIFGAG